MHVPGHNPFITQIGETIDTPIQYLTGFNVAGAGGDDPTAVALSSIANVPINLGTYQYQGISPDIMQALGNVFSPSGVTNFNIDELASDNISQQIQNYLFGQGLLHQGGIPNFDADVDDYGLENSELVQNLFIAPSSLSMNPVDSVLGFTNIFDPESIAATLSQISDKDIQAAEVKALTPEMIEKTTSEYYSPYEESERESLVEKLGTAMSKAQTGGFAGSGARQSGLSGAERLYRGGYGDILSDILKMRGQATGDVLDTIYGYQELLDQG